jgi:hypothetical protein
MNSDKFLEDGMILRNIYTGEQVILVQDASPKLIALAINSGHVATRCNHKLNGLSIEAAMPTNWQFVKMAKLVAE